MDDKQFHEAVLAKVAEMKAKFVAPADVTEAELAALNSKITAKAKSEVKAEERDAALMTLIELARNVAGDDPAVVQACTLLERKQRAVRASGATRAASGPRTSRFTILETEFSEVGTIVHEDALFAKYKMGRKDVYWLIADAIKGAKDASLRKWISFNPSDGNYTYEAQGEEPPLGWTGYVPALLKVPKAAAPVEENAEF